MICQGMLGTVIQSSAILYFWRLRAGFEPGPPWPPTAFTASAPAGTPEHASLTPAAKAVAMKYSAQLQRISQLCSHEACEKASGGKFRFGRTGDDLEQVWETRRVFCLYRNYDLPRQAQDEREKLENASILHRNGRQQSVHSGR